MAETLMLEVDEMWGIGEDDKREPAVIHCYVFSLGLGQYQDINTGKKYILGQTIFRAQPDAIGRLISLLQDRIYILQERIVWESNFLARFEAKESHDA